MSVTSLDETTQANIIRARTAHGQLPTRYRVPFRNIRDVLGLHTKADYHKPFLIAYDEVGERNELSYGYFTGRIHQVANFLYEDLGVQRGQRIATLGGNQRDIVVIYFACWLIGAAVVPLDAEHDDDQIAFILRESAAACIFATHDHLDRAQRHVDGQRVKGVVQVGGERREAFLYFYDVVANRPTSFLGDDSGSKEADVPLTGGNERTATLEDTALLSYTADATGTLKGVLLSQYNLLVNAQAISEAQAITGNQRMMSALPIHTVNGIVMTLLVPLLVGGSTVLNDAFSAAHLWERIVRERVHVVPAVVAQLRASLDYAQQQRAAGDTIFGMRINRPAVKHFRHFICSDAGLSVALAQEFEELFGFAIFYGYSLDETSGFSSLLPITQSWAAHQSSLFGHDYASVGCSLSINEMAIFDAEGNGSLLEAGQRGELCVRGHNVMQRYHQGAAENAKAFKFGWLRSGVEGFYRIGEDGRRYFFITGRRV